MTCFRGSTRWFAGLVLAMLACLPVRASAFESWGEAIPDLSCDVGEHATCEEIAHGDSHCHCLETGRPDPGRQSAASSLPSSTASRAPDLLPRVSSGEVRASFPRGFERTGAPAGSPLAARVGLILHD